MSNVFTKVPLRRGSCEVITIEDDDDEPVLISEPEPKVEPNQDKQSVMIVEKTDVKDGGQKSGLSVAVASASTAASTTTSIGYIEACQGEINSFCHVLKSKVPPKDYEKLKGKLLKKFNALEDQPKEFHEKLTMKFASGIRKIQEGENVYTRITILMKRYMKPGDSKFLQLKSMEEYVTSDDETKKADREAEKDKKVAKLENMLQQKIHQKIQELDEEEVDLSDESNLHNSAFMMRDKLIHKSMKVFYSLCEAKKCLTQTGRPTQKKINIQNTTMYPEMEEAVQNFVNKKNHLFLPDFADIYNIVSAENHRIHLGSEALHKIAKDLHKQVVLEIQERRQQDTRLAFPSSCDLGTRDPAEDDAELERKLEANKKKGRTIESIVDKFAEFAKNQRLQTEGDETDEDESSVESEDEDEPTSNADLCSYDGLSNIRVSEEYAAGPQAECLGDDEDDEEQDISMISQRLVFPPEDKNATAAASASSTANVNESTKNENETEEPQTKKRRIV